MWNLWAIEMGINLSVLRTNVYKLVNILQGVKDSALCAALLIVIVTLSRQLTLLQNLVPLNLRSGIYLFINWATEVGGTQVGKASDLAEGWPAAQARGNGAVSEG